MMIGGRLPVNVGKAAKSCVEITRSLITSFEFVLFAVRSFHNMVFAKLFPKAFVLFRAFTVN